MKVNLLIAALLTISTATIAADKHEINKTFAVNNTQNLEIDFPVGSIVINHHDSNEIIVNIELEAKNNDSWFSSDIDLSTISLDEKQTNNELDLEIDHDDIEQTWRVTLPQSLSLDIELGVGSVEINQFANSANVDVGVGSVEINTLLDDYKRIKLDTGVGDSSIKGLKNSGEQQRSIVSSKSDYRGNGQYSIDVEVGVGDIKVRH